MLRPTASVHNLKSPKAATEILSPKKLFKDLKAPQCSCARKSQAPGKTEHTEDCELKN
jgi:hypothetical protein